MVFESFEASLDPAVVMSATDKILCTYPDPAIRVPPSVSQNNSFRINFASFISQMNQDRLQSSMAKTTKAGSTVAESRGVANPKYITQLLTEILRGMGSVENVPRIQKRIADDVLWSNAKNPWRRFVNPIP